MRLEAGQQVRRELRRPGLSSSSPRVPAQPQLYRPCGESNISACSSSEPVSTAWGGTPRAMAFPPPGLKPNGRVLTLGLSPCDLSTVALESYLPNGHILKSAMAHCHLQQNAVANPEPSPCFSSRGADWKAAWWCLTWAAPPCGCRARPAPTPEVREELRPWPLPADCCQRLAIRCQ